MTATTPSTARANTDALDFNGSNIGELLSVSANAGRVRFTRNVASIVMDLDGIEALNTRTVGGADVATVSDLAGTDVKTVDFDLGGADGQLDAVVAAGPGEFAFAGGALVKGVTARVTIAGADGADALRVDGTGPSDRVTFMGTDGADAFDFVANGTFARLGDAETTGVESVLATGGGGDDSFTGTGNLAALTQFTFDGGNGNDTLRGGNGADILLGGSGDDLVDGNQGTDTAPLGSGNDRFNWDPGDGNDTVEGQSGTDALDFHGLQRSASCTTLSCQRRPRALHPQHREHRDGPGGRRDRQHVLARRRRHGHRHRPGRHGRQGRQRRPRRRGRGVPTRSSPAARAPSRSPTGRSSPASARV